MNAAGAHFNRDLVVAVDGVEVRHAVLGEVHLDYDAKKAGDLVSRRSRPIQISDILLGEGFSEDEAREVLDTLNAEEFAARLSDG